MSGTIKSIDPHLGVSRSQLLQTLKNVKNLDPAVVQQLVSLTQTSIQDPQTQQNVSTQLQRMLQVIPKTAEFQQLRQNLQNFMSDLKNPPASKSHHTPSPLSSSGAPVKAPSISTLLFDALEKQLKVSPLERLLQALHLSSSDKATDVYAKTAAWVSSNPQAIKQFLLQSPIQEVCDQLRQQVAKQDTDNDKKLFSAILSSCLATITPTSATEVEQIRALIDEIPVESYRERAMYSADPQFTPLARTLNACEQHGNKQQLFTALCKDLGPDSVAIADVWQQLGSNPITAETFKALGLDPNSAKEFETFYQTFDHQAFADRLTQTILNRL